jgi:S1-C subfamily serine protease
MTSSTDTDSLATFEDAVRTATDAARAATVSIGQDGRGSGIVIAAGSVLTNAHNLRDRSTSVTFADGRSEQGIVTGIDEAGDLVVLAVDTGDATPIAWADEPAADGAVVFGVSLGARGSRASLGIVSGTGRTFRGPRGRAIAGSVEHTAPLARGSSGGPLVDRFGKLVGINTHRLGEGFYLAVSADADLHQRVDGLIAGQSPRRLTLGIAIAPAHVAARLRQSVGLEARDGLLVRGVETDSPADKVGIRQGDLLTSAGGQTLTSAEDLFGVLDGHDPSESLAVELVRGAESVTVSVAFEVAADE